MLKYIVLIHSVDLAIAGPKCDALKASLLADSGKLLGFLEDFGKCQAVLPFLPKQRMDVQDCPAECEPFDNKFLAFLDDEQVKGCMDEATGNKTFFIVAALRGLLGKDCWSAYKIYGLYRLALQFGGDLVPRCPEQVVLNGFDALMKGFGHGVQCMDDFARVVTPFKLQTFQCPVTCVSVVDQLTYRISHLMEYFPAVKTTVAPTTTSVQTNPIQKKLEKKNVYGKCHDLLYDHLNWLYIPRIICAPAPATTTTPTTTPIATTAAPVVSTMHHSSAAAMILLPVVLAII